MTITDAHPISGEHPIVDAATWRAKRLEHLAAEKAFTHEREALAAKRRKLPWLEIEGDYRFEGLDGSVSLPDLFEGHEQLIVYHFMFGPDWEEGCPSCSFWADNLSGVDVHLQARNSRFVVASRAPLASLEAYRARMGWTFPWYSTLGSQFNFDMGVSFTPEQIESGEPSYNFGTSPPMGEESPGLSTFRRVDDRVFLTYQTFARGLDVLNGAYHLLDATSLGRDEDRLPWPMSWLARSDSYSADASGG